MTTSFPELLKFIKSDVAASAGIYKTGIPLSEIKDNIIVIDTTEWLPRLCLRIAQKNPRGVLLCDHEAPGSGARLLETLIDEDIDNYLRSNLNPFYVFPGVHKNSVGTEEPERNQYKSAVSALQRALNSSPTPEVLDQALTKCTYHYYLNHIDAIISRAMRHMESRHVECMRAPYYAWTQATFLSILSKGNPVQVYGTLHLGITRPLPCILEIDFASKTYSLLDTAALRKFLGLEAQEQKDDATRRIVTAAVLSGYDELTPQRTDVLDRDTSTPFTFVKVANILASKQTAQHQQLSEQDYKDVTTSLYTNPLVVDLLSACIMMHIHGPILNKFNNCSIFPWLNDPALTLKYFGQKLPDIFFFAMAFGFFPAAPLETFINGKIERDFLILSSEDAIALRMSYFASIRRKALGLLSPYLKEITGFTTLKEKPISGFISTTVGPFDPIVPLCLK